MIYRGYLGALRLHAFAPELPKYVKHAIMREQRVRSASHCLDIYTIGARCKTKDAAFFFFFFNGQEEKTLMFISHEFHIVKKITCTK